MASLTRFVCRAMAFAFGLALCGCFPSSQSQLDEEKEPHYLVGKARVNAMDYQGAMAAFEKALEVNPRSAAAHFELGLLCEKNEMDYAAAIYHFESYLRLRPSSDYGDIVRGRILGCKQELAKTVSLGPVTQGLQREFEQLAEENRRLREEVEKWRAYYASRGPGATNLGGGSLASGGATSVSGLRQAPLAGPVTPGVSDADRPPAARTHKVQAGETPAAIARKYGVRVEALLAANPGLNPRRLQVGQMLNIPPP